MQNRESEEKTKLIKAIKAKGGWGRRFEDQYAVGVLDMTIILPGLPVFIAEGKLVKNGYFEPTQRQWLEMTRIDEAGDPEKVRAILVGFSDNCISFSLTTKRAYMSDKTTFHCDRKRLEPYDMFYLFNHWIKINGR